ncbi:MAG: NAD(P)-binding domain-containing protein [Prolixibacteraceae bacterium]|nr:NAD(P)-binding domain-containing protein [Prolixibacteraceae bacterium]
MNMKSIGFIGGESLTRVILQAFANHQREFQSVWVYDKNNAATEKIKEVFTDIKIAESVHDAAQRPVVFIAVDPDEVEKVLAEIETDITPETTIVSLVPKITISKISSFLKTRRIVRVIPPLTSYINQGFVPVVFKEGFPPYEKFDLLGMFSHFGKTLEVNENLIEPYVLISGFLPCYFLLQWEELVSVATGIGLTPHEISDVLEKTVEASVNLMFNSDEKVTEVTGLIHNSFLSKQEQAIKSSYREMLSEVYEKIKPKK